jgi:hypothetical protein
MFVFELFVEIMVVAPFLPRGARNRCVFHRTGDPRQTHPGNKRSSLRFDQANRQTVRLAAFAVSFGLLASAQDLRRKINI